MPTARAPAALTGARLHARVAARNRSSWAATARSGRALRRRPRHDALRAAPALRHEVAPRCVLTAAGDGGDELHRRRFGGDVMFAAVARPLSAAVREPLGAASVGPSASCAYGGVGELETVELRTTDVVGFDRFSRGNEPLDEDAVALSGYPLEFSSTTSRARCSGVRWPRTARRASLLQRLPAPLSDGAAVRADRLGARRRRGRHFCASAPDVATARAAPSPYLKSLRRFPVSSLGRCERARAACRVC